MNLSSYLSPLTVGAAAAGLLLAGALLIGIYQGRRTISRQIKKAGEALFSQVGFFTIVILVFLIISVLESGSFFNENITHEALFGILGYALALGFDLVSVVCMLARMGAIRMRDERGARLNLLGVMLCAAVSAFANTAASLQGYQSSNLSHTPWWMQQVAPYLGTIFPTMIVVLSLTTDHLLDNRGPAKGIDLNTYRAQEKRRVDMLQIKLDTEKELLKLDRELSSLRTQRGQSGGHLPREWFFVRWMRPVIPPTQEMITEYIGQAVASMRQDLDNRVGQLQTLVTSVDTHLLQLDTRLNELAERDERHNEALDILREQVSRLAAVVTTMTTRLDTLDSQTSTLTEQINTRGIQLDTLRATVQQRLDASHGQVSNQQGEMSDEVISQRVSSGHRRRVRRTIKLDTFREERNSSQEAETSERTDIEERILAAQQTLGPGASNRQIARLVNCSPTTVAKWLPQQRGTQQEPA
jgi:DNA-binding NarL/FixJ family response regulator